MNLRFILGGQRNFARALRASFEEKISELKSQLEGVTDASERAAIRDEIRKVEENFNNEIKKASISNLW